MPTAALFAKVDEPGQLFMPNNFLGALFLFIAIFAACLVSRDCSTNPRGSDHQRPAVRRIVGEEISIICL